VKKLPYGCARQSLGTEYGRCSRSAADGSEAEAVAEGREAADNLVEDVPVEPRPASGVSGGLGALPPVIGGSKLACDLVSWGLWAPPPVAAGGEAGGRFHIHWSWPKAPGVRCSCSVFPLCNLNSAGLCAYVHAQADVVLGQKQLACVVLVLYFLSNINSAGLCAYVHAQAAPRALYRLDLHTHTAV
jgi:hypothetical protein